MLTKPWGMNTIGVSLGTPHLHHQQTACVRESRARCQALFSKWFVSRGLECLFLVGPSSQPGLVPWLNEVPLPPSPRTGGLGWPSQSTPFNLVLGCPTVIRIFGAQEGESVPHLPPPDSGWSRMEVSPSLGALLSLLKAGGEPWPSLCQGWALLSPATWPLA